MTALALINDIGQLPESRRKALVVMAAFVLGGGIWSMHFLAILSLQFSVPVHYGLLRTLASGLIAVLVVGFALLLLHFRERTRLVLNVAGVSLGLGIVSMHFVGMLGMHGVIPTFNLGAIAAASVIALVTGVMAVRVAYTQRTRQNIVKGGVLFGLSVVVVHYASMLGTVFTVDPDYDPQAASLGQDALAVTVTLAAFCICGAFLLAASTFIPRREIDRVAPVADPAQSASTTGGAQTESPAPVLPTAATPASVRIPYEENRQTLFVGVDEVGAIRADGRYTQLYTRHGVKLCPWSITDAEQRLNESGFYRSHRSYLINLEAVSGFEKHRETGTCRLEGFAEIGEVPVSRSRVSALVASLGL